MMRFTVLKSMKRNKSPGPDGFNVNSFIHCWDWVWDDFIKAVKFLFSSCRMPMGINSTALAIIPKSENPSSMADFRLISYCNTIYKCIAKILSNRLKVVLPTIIDKAQTSLKGGVSMIIFCSPRNSLETIIGHMVLLDVPSKLTSKKPLTLFVGNSYLTFWSFTSSLLYSLLGLKHVLLQPGSQLRLMNLLQGILPSPGALGKVVLSPHTYLFF